jgi:hypothetical protein
MRRNGEGKFCGLEVDGVLRWVELSRRSEARDAGVVPRRVEHVKVAPAGVTFGLAGVRATCVCM